MEKRWPNSSTLFSYPVLMYAFVFSLASSAHSAASVEISQFWPQASRRRSGVKPYGGRYVERGAVAAQTEVRMAHHLEFLLGAAAQ